MGLAHQKRIRSLYVGYWTDGDLKLSVSFDDDTAIERTLSQIDAKDSRAHGHKVPFTRSGKGRFITFTLENIDGADFTLADIRAVLIALSRRPGEMI